MHAQGTHTSVEVGNIHPRSALMALTEKATIATGAALVPPAGAAMN